LHFGCDDDRLTGTDSGAVVDDRTLLRRHVYPGSKQRCASYVATDRTRSRNFVVEFAAASSRCSNGGGAPPMTK